MNVNTETYGHRGQYTTAYDKPTAVSYSFAVETDRPSLTVSEIWPFENLTGNGLDRKMTSQVRSDCGIR